VKNVSNWKEITAMQMNVRIVIFTKELKIKIVVSDKTIVHKLCFPSEVQVRNRKNLPNLHGQSPDF